jgi:hypothetical protein
MKNLNLAIGQLDSGGQETDQSCQKLSKGIQFLSYFYNIDGNKKNFNSF